MGEGTGMGQGQGWDLVGDRGRPVERLLPILITYCEGIFDPNEEMIRFDGSSYKM